MKQLLALEPTKAILVLASILAAVCLGAAYLIGGDKTATSLASGSFLAVGILLYKTRKSTRNIGAATALIGQAIALTTAFQGHPWQLDTHMLFFALLACLIVLRSIPAILTATVVTALHHLSLSVLMPALVFPGGAIEENLARTVFHAVIVLLETAVLISTVVMLQRLEAKMRSRADELKDTVLQSDAARAEADAARLAAETLRAEAKAAQSNAEKLLKDSKIAEESRLDAERQREASQAEFAKTAQKKSDEQSHVVAIIQEAMQRLQTGDLTTRIDADLPESYRDLRVAFNSALQALDTAVAQVAFQSGEMQTQVLEIASATADLAKRTEQQAQLLRESSEGLDELTQVVSKTEESVGEANVSAQTAHNNAKSSEKIVSQTSDAMSAIRTEAEEISQIVKVIDEIAFQTNLLALNAGVEAARAGDAGRGFAVVASEVRGLAQRSSESATNIRGLIERSGQQVEVGSTKIEETVTSLSSVLDAVIEITSKTARIADGAHEQSSSIAELNRKVAGLDTTTQQNAAMFEETSAACANLQDSAVALGKLTQAFQLSGLKATQTVAA